MVSKWVNNLPIIGVLTHLLTIDPNFLGHPSSLGLLFKKKMELEDLQKEACFSLASLHISQAPKPPEIPDINLIQSQNSRESYSNPPPPQMLPLPKTRV